MLPAAVRTPLRERAIPAGLAVLALVLALVQRPGLASSDTKIDLHVDPVAFLGDVASAWSPTGDLGHVQGGQYGGYLFPMGPFFALGRLLGLAPWLVQRLWLATILAMAGGRGPRPAEATPATQARFRRRPGREIAHLALPASCAGPAATS